MNYSLHFVREEDRAIVASASPPTPSPSTRPARSRSASMSISGRVASVAIDLAGEVLARDDHALEGLTPDLAAEGHRPRRREAAGDDQDCPRAPAGHRPGDAGTLRGGRPEGPPRLPGWDSGVVLRQAAARRHRDSGVSLASRRPMRGHPRSGASARWRAGLPTSSILSISAA